MSDVFFVNNQNATTTWGATLQKGALEALLKPSAAKPFTENKSRSMPGKMVLPRNPQPEPRDIALNISIKGNNFADYLTKSRSFFAELAQGIVQFRVPMLNETYRLIYKNSTLRKVNCGTNFGTFRIEFEEFNLTNRSL